MTTTRYTVTAMIGLTLAVASTHALAAQVMNTGDVAKRGLSERDFPRARELAPGVYSYEALRSGDPGGKMTTVSLIVITNDGVLVADGQGNAAQTKEMVDWIAKTTRQPIKYVVIGSDHGDHTGGNAAFPAGVTYLASPASVRALASSTNGAPTPLDTVLGKRVLNMGGTTIEVLDLGRAHTGGDLSVYVPNGRVLFLSEAYLHWIFPAMRSAHPSEWVAMLKKAEAMDAVWYVPGHGFVDDAKTLAADLRAYRRALEDVIAEATRLHRARVPCAPPPQGTRPGVPREPCEAAARGNWGDLRGWTLFGSQLEIAIRRVYDELDGKLPPGGPPSAGHDAGLMTAMVDVDGLSMRVRTAGLARRDGRTPAVIFESGGGVPLETWDAILPAVAAFAPVVAYDRAGAGQSAWDSLPPPGVVPSFATWAGASPRMSSVWRTSTRRTSRKRRRTSFGSSRRSAQEPRRATRSTT